MEPFAYMYEGVLYCARCSDGVDHERALYELLDDDSHEDYILGSCCGCCGHNMACMLKHNGPMWENCPGPSCMESN